MCEADLKAKIYEVQAERFLSSFLKSLTKKELISIKKKIAKTVNQGCLKKRIVFHPQDMVFVGVIEKHPVIHEDLETVADDQKKNVLHGKTGEFLDDLKEPVPDRVNSNPVFQGCYRTRPFLRVKPLKDENG